MSTSSTSAPNPPPPSDGGPKLAADLELIVGAGEDNIRAKGRLLYPERGPSRFAARMATAALGELGRAGPGRLVLLSSPGLWYGVRELLDGLPPDSALLCVEMEPSLAALSGSRIPPDLASDPRLLFLASPSAKTLLAAAESLGRFRRVHPVSLSGGADLAPLAYREATALLDEAFASWWKNRATLAAMGRLWVRNIFRNLSRLEEIAPGAVPALPGPAIVCGAGPSLEAALPFIAANRERLRVIAADTALTALLESGIVPDLVVCLEAQVWNLRDFVGLGGADFWLLGDLSSHPDSYRIPASRRLLSAVRIEAGPFMDRLHEAGLPLLDLPPLGSVGVQALHAALAFGAGPLFIAGLDFTFAAGKTHARGCPATRTEALGQSRLKPIGSTGLAVSFRQGVTRAEPSGELSDPNLRRYAALLAEEIGAARTEVFDLRMGRGLPLGARPLSFDEAAALLASREPMRRKEETVPADPREGDQEVPARARSFIDRERGRLEDLEAILKGRRALEREKLPALIGELDYLLWPMPDVDRLEALPQDLLNRILVETEYWLAILEEGKKG